jgi:hypothetical protein
MNFCKNIAFIVLLIFYSTVNFSQRQNVRSKSEIGAYFGGMYYIGDLNSSKHFANTNATLGAIYRYFINPRLIYRVQFGYGNLKASDSQFSNAFQKNRNLSFQTDVFEFATGIEMNYMKYQTGHKDFFFTPYVYFELGLFRINPKTDYNGELVELQSLGTEGQGTELSNKKAYKKVQLCLPIGLGFKVSINKRTSFSIEYGLRKTFTDYIDDVSSNTYLDRTKLGEINGPIVSDLSNRSLDGNEYGKRGNPTTKDWYFVLNAMLTFKLGNPDKCFH